MQSTSSSVAQFRQERLSKFGQIIALIILTHVGLNAAVSIWLGRLSFNRASIPLLAAGTAFVVLWRVLRGAPKPPHIVRAVELTTLLVGSAAVSSTALVLDLTSSPDMIVRSALTYMLLVYAVYVPSTARHTLMVAAFMTLPLLGSIFLAFRAWDPSLYDPPAATWPKGNVGDMAYPATLVSAALWGIVVAIAAGFSQTIHGLRQVVRDIRQLGQYTLEDKLGEGGMGVVYRASHAMLRRPTAVKLLSPERVGPAAVARFEQEVQRTAMLTHPNTVTVYDYGRTEEGVFYYAMELLEGTTLEELVELDGPQPAARVIHLLAQVAASLAEAHEAGLIHRDIKPANILLVDRGGIPDLVKVVDFGLVKEVGSSSVHSDAKASLKVSGAIVGTPLYMAPEVLTTPEIVDARADLYAVGAVGYWLLTGTHVFAGSTIVEVCLHHVHSSPESPSSRLGAPVAADLERLLLACLSKRPDDRPPSARFLGEQLRACVNASQWNERDAREWWTDHGSQLARHDRNVSGSATDVQSASLTIDVDQRSPKRSRSRARSSQTNWLGVACL